MDKKKLLSKKGVVSIGRGLKTIRGRNTGEEAIVIGVNKKLSPHLVSKKDLIPKTINGELTDVVEVGEIKALTDPKARHRPVPSGVSVGHYEVTAGTLGCWVKKNGEYFLLSNNHVLANVNQGFFWDSVLQPGVYDGGQMPGDVIGNLIDYIPISLIDVSSCPIGNTVAGVFNFLAKVLRRETRLITQVSITNLVDCAIALPMTDKYVLAEVLGIGKIKGETEAQLGQTVTKAGRTTGITEGVVSQVDVTINVNMGIGYAVFEDQVMVTGNFSAPGDSGSAVLTIGKKICGLLFAGGEGVTIFNRWANVKEALGLEGF